MAKTEDRRRFLCHNCGGALVQIGQRCGLCGRTITQAGVDAADRERKRADHPATRDVRV